MNYTLRNAVPISLTTFLQPRMRSRIDSGTSGSIAQDQWTIRRLTVNAGVRFDTTHDSIPDQSSGPGPVRRRQNLAGCRRFAELERPLATARGRL